MTGDTIEAKQRPDSHESLPAAAEPIVLTATGSLAFAAMLLNPPEPNAQLHRAVQSHQALIGEAPQYRQYRSKTVQLTSRP